MVINEDTCDASKYMYCGKCKENSLERSQIRKEDLKLSTHYHALCKVDTKGESYSSLQKQGRDGEIIIQEQEPVHLPSGGLAVADYDSSPPCK